MSRRLIAAAGVATLAVGLVPATVSAAIPDPLPPESIAEVAVAAGFDTLVDAVTAAGLADGLADCSADPVTVFAPTDEAFAALPPETLEAALADPTGLLTTVLTYHVVPGIQEASVVTASTALTTAQGEDISVEGTVLNGSVNITGTDNFACNGVVHVIDAVLLPPSLSQPESPIPDPLPDESIAELATSAGLDTLVAAVTAAGLADGLADCSSDPVTVFAPTEEAFAAVPEDLLNAALGDPDGLLTDILTYHVVPGIVPAAEVVEASSLTTALGQDLAVDGTVLNGSVNITAPDNFACNGVVHLIDGVLLPELPSIAQIATDAGFDTLLAAVTAAGLADGLADCSADPVTVFAPTEEAFAALPPETLAAALADPTGLLTTVLTYHVVPGLVGSGEVVEATSLTTAQGEAISVEGTVLNGSVNIVATDNWACNGVVHVIDAVLLPPSLSEPTEPAPTTTTVPVTTPPDGELPATGTETTVMLIVAGLLLAGGFALIRLRRTAA